MNESNRIRVVIVDDHHMVRRGLAAFLRVKADLELVGEAGGGREAVEVCARARPDVVLMDLVMPDLDGAAATRAIKKRCPEVQVIALTSFGDKELVQGALEAGAISYLLKNVSADDLAEAIRAAHGGLSTLAPEALQALVETGQEPPPGRDLTSREREVLALLVEGLTNREIAARLTVSLSTARAHVSHILSKLDVSNRAEAVALALKLKLVT
jgi:NarL family two-component system response regulator LiaR